MEPGGDAPMSAPGLGWKQGQMEVNVDTGAPETGGIGTADAPLIPPSSLAALEGGVISFPSSAGAAFQPEPQWMFWAPKMHCLRTTK